MTNRKLVITYKPDVLSMLPHSGSWITDKETGNVSFDKWKGLTARSEREGFKNIKSKESAMRIVGRRNKNEILFANYNNEVIYPEPQEK